MLVAGTGRSLIERPALTQPLAHYHEADIVIHMEHLMSRPTIQDTTVDHMQDEAAIRQIIAEVEAGFNTKDADLMNNHISQNALRHLAE